VPGLVPGIHAVRKPPTSKVSCNGTAWMAGTSPAKTPRGSIHKDTTFCDSPMTRFSAISIAYRKRYD
jgi:hypothetical protein